MFQAPVRFAPIYQTRVWGGRRLETLLGRKLPESEVPYGESWEVSDRPEAESVVISGEAKGLTLNDLWMWHRREVFGEHLAGHPAERFPLLMKILDACDDLSIQVHPPAAVAAELGGEPKTEMWYIAHTEPGAKLYAGLRQGVTKEALQSALAEGNVAECVHVIEPKRGDCLFLPSGRIHAIGAGLLIYEIQQNSDTTYRVFDWNRVGLDGKPRALHVEESLQSIDFSDVEPTVQQRGGDGTLAVCEYFDVKLKHSARQETVGRAGEGLTFAMVSGQLTLAGETWHAGDFAMVPACLAQEQRSILAASGDAAWLEVCVP
ncbi:MAG: type I phosphomannose isomerase catalytic subunit [Prosthecobacter sp.]|nr:type I phosphomannose isomerase catalytic subunit [Prosthecobacter sp.]